MSLKILIYLIGGVDKSDEDNNDSNMLLYGGIILVGILLVYFVVMPMLSNTPPASGSPPPASGSPPPASGSPPSAPVNCAVSDWSPLSACSTTCGGGTQTKNRMITTEAANGGTQCPTLTDSQPCNTQACPVNCAVSSWSPCNCLTNSQSRTITTQPAGTGAACPDLTQSCVPTAADCNDWYTMDDTYVSHGQFINRTCETTFKNCYSKCDGGACAGVYAYNGPSNGSSIGCGGPNIECSTISAGNVPILYGNQGRLGQASTRHAFISKSLMGSAFNPNGVRMVSPGSVA